MAIGTLTGLQVARRRPRQNEWAQSLGGDVLAFLIGLGSCFTLKIIGDIPICELILIPSLPLLFTMNPHRLRLRQRRIGVILSLMFLWLLGQIVTDVYRSTASRDWLRGDANIVFFILDMIGLAILLKGNMRRQMILFFGLAIGLGLAPILEPSLFTGEGTALKFGYAWTILYLATLASCHFYRRRQYFLAGLFLIGDIIFNGLHNFRTVTLTMFVATCLVLPIIPEKIGQFRILPKGQTPARVLTVLGIALISGALTGKVMTTLAASGLLGAEAQWKNQQQTSAGWGILIGGRPEIIVSARAVMDSPILGHGSWAKDPKYVAMLNEIEAEYGMQVLDPQGERYAGLIPAHSHLMGAWVNAGIVGAIFWIYILVSTLKSIVRASLARIPVKPVYVCLLTLLLWDILFSPFGGLRRVTVSFFIVIICEILDPDNSARQMARRAFARAQFPMQIRNLGRISPGLRPSLMRAKV